MINELPLNQILCGNCVEVLKDFPDNSIDLVVTDPPYGLSFMGKDWDKALPSRDAFEQIIRVLKPGALAFVMSSPRQDLLWRMLSMLEGVGFELNQSYVEWIYKTGFPKAYDVSKGIDKRNDRHLQYSDFGKYLKTKRKEKGLSKKQIDTNLGTNTAYSWWEGRNYLDTFIIRPPSKKNYELLKTILNLDNRFDELIERLEAEREIVGKGQWSSNGKYRSVVSSLEEGGRLNPSYDETAPSTDLAKKWSGWKSQTGLKPAHEPILMVNKPFSEPTIVDNVLRWGTGAINVDVCRIPFQGEDDIGDPNRFKTAWSSEGSNEGWKRPSHDNYVRYPIGIKGGRFPANLLVSDKALDTGKISRSPDSYVRMSDGFNKNSYGIGMGESKGKKSLNYGDVGDQSRYFDLDAWARHHGFLDVPKPDNKERDFGLKGIKRIPTSKLNLSDGKNPVRLDGEIPNPRRNTHPTVKPIKLMAYLIELGCPPDGVVLDPFVGSGTTCIAAKQLVRKYVGIEINPEYAKMAQARIKAHPVPLSWFNEDCRLPPKEVNEK